MTNDRKLTWLASLSHLITHGYMTLLPAVLVVIAGEHSLSFLDIGLIANIGYFLYGLGAIPTGYLADRFGSKRMLTIGISGMAFSSILVGLSPSALTFALTYALLGSFASIHHPAGLSLIARHVRTKGKALGLHGVLGNVGLFLTPLAAAFSVKFFHTWRAAYIVYGLLGIPLALSFYFVRLENEPDLSWRALFSRPEKQPAASTETPVRETTAPPPVAVIPAALLFLYLGCILSGFIFRGSLTFFPTLFRQEIHFITTHDEPVVIAGYVTTAVLSLGLIGSWFGGYLNDRIRRPELFPLAIFIVVTPCLYFISRFIDTPLIWVSALFSLVYYAWQPSQNYLIARYTKKASHGMGFGVNFFLLFGIGSVATAIGGWMADDFGVDRFYLLMSWVAAACTACALAVYLARRFQIQFSWRLVRNDPDEE